MLAALASAFGRKPLIWHLHDILSAEHFGPAQLRLVRILANRFSSRVIVPSIAVAEAFVELGGRAELLSIVPNGVSMGATAGTDRAGLRKRLGLPTGFLFGVFSRLSPWKGQDVALRALAALPGAQCIIVGDALFGETEYVAQLHRMASAKEARCRAK